MVSSDGSTHSSAVCLNVMLKARLACLCFSTSPPRKRGKFIKLAGKKVHSKPFTFRFLLSLIGTEHTQPQICHFCWERSISFAFLLCDWFVVKQEVQIQLQQEQWHKWVSLKKLRCVPVPGEKQPRFLLFSPHLQKCWSGSEPRWKVLASAFFFSLKLKIWGKNMFTSVSQNTFQSFLNNLALATCKRYYK